MSDDAARQVVAELLRSRKCGHLCSDTLSRVARWAAERHPSLREATKAAKRKLHQVYGAYFDQFDIRRMERAAGSLPPAGDDAALRVVCREVLSCHASTAERLVFLDELCPALFALIGPPASIADLACGLNPFALPWMSLPPDTPYYACDIDGRVVTAIETFLACYGRPLTVECRDILVSPPAQQVDVVLLLKTAPCLEQQEKGATLRVLRALNARHVVLSFPTRSLGGKSKGMREHYEATASRLAESLGVAMRRTHFPTETFYVLTMR
jgi:16S rRNA (guanine(1405)-N(7))-methyltransferase